MKTLVKRFLTFALIMVMLFTSVPFIGVDLQVGAIDGRVEQAVQTAIAIANDNSHGYSQSNRRGPDYDCSSLVYYAFSSAGFSLSPTWFNTANMGTALKNAGFVELDPNSTSPQRGDILWKTGHTEMHIGNNQLVGAHSDYGSPQTGDQSGNEISVGTYYHRDKEGNLNWEKIYRYGGSSTISNVWVSLNKEDESSFKVGEAVDISFGASNATKFTLIIFKYQDVYWQGEYYSTSGQAGCPASFDSVGHYSCYVVAENSSGEKATSRWVGWDIVDGIPVNLKIVIDKGNNGIYSVEEPIVFDLSADFGYYKYIGIHKKDGSEDSLYYGESISGSSYSIVINEPGDYYADFDAFNTYGTARSEKIFFTVTNSPPSYAKVSIAGDVRPIYYIGETIKFYMDTICEERKYIGIHKDNTFYKGDWVEVDYYEYTFNETGHYYVDFEASNPCGQTLSNRIYFEVTDKILVNYIVGQQEWKIEELTIEAKNKVTEDVPTLSGYVFEEWNTKPDGTGVSYQPGDTYSENVDLTLYAIWTPACQHEYASAVTQQPTCTEKGVKAFTCSLCNDVYYEDIEELGHNYVACVTQPTCTNQGFTTYECSRCLGSYIEDYTEPLNHSSFSWLTVVNPTITSEGLAEKRCDYCGEVLDQFTIPCLAPDYVTGIVLSSEKETVSIGDTFALSATVLPDTAKNKNVVWSSRNSEIAAVDNGTVTAVKPGTTAIVAKTEDGGYIGFCLVRVTSIVAFNGAVVDNDKNIIYGLSSNLLTVDSYLETADSNMTINLSTPTVGTGTFINVTENGEIIDSYEAVIFGDVNGDGWYDGTDSIIVSCLANGLLSKDDVSPAFYTAADCNHDGVIDSFDVAILEQAGLLLSNVDQSKSNEELATDEAFIEYLDLIDQTPEDEDIVEDEVIETPEVETETKEFDLIEFIITIIKKFFELLLSTLPIK